MEAEIEWGAWGVGWWMGAGEGVGDGDEKDAERAEGEEKCEEGEGRGGTRDDERARGDAT